MQKQRDYFKTVKEFQDECTRELPMHETLYPQP